MAIREVIVSGQDFSNSIPELAALRARLDVVRPLDSEQIRLLWPMVENESVFYTYATNAIEGSTLSLGETAVVLNDGVTIGGKTVREHLDAINGEKAYRHMPDLAKGGAPNDEEAIKYDDRDLDPEPWIRIVERSSTSAAAEALMSMRRTRTSRPKGGT